MITLRLDIDEVNTIYKALDAFKSDPAAEPMKRVRVMEKITAAADKDISTWDGYVVNEVNTVLEALLPESESGNIGIQYDKVIKEQYETGPIYDDTQAKGVAINIVLEFGKTIKIK